MTRRGFSRNHLLVRAGIGLFIAGASLPSVRADGSLPVGQFRVPDGLEVSVWAESPLLRNPTNIDLDRHGRLWVAESVNYRGFQSHRQESLWRESGDRIVVLEDADGDGRAERSTVFVQDPDLIAPLGLAVLGNRVLVSCSPHLLLYTDANEDGIFDPAVDKKEILLTGFGGKDHDHGLHAVVAGPDGAWYFNAGNAGPHIVTDRAGWTLRAGSSYTGGTPYNTRNTPGLKSDDGRVYVGGLALSMQPDGTGLSVYAHNFRNNYEVCLDSLGNLFQNDNDDQVVACRTTWLMQHANAGYASADGERTWQADRRPGQPIPAAHWHQDDPGVIPDGDLYGAGSPTGMTVYEDDRLGESFRGILLSGEAGRNVVWGYHVRPSGAGYDLERFAFLASVAEDDPDYRWDERDRDPRKWFRPADVAVGPDGAVYVADWFDPVVGGHQMDDRQGRGAIYRVAPTGFANRALPIPPFDLTTTPGQIEALRSPAVNVRFLGFEKLREQGSAALPLVAALLTDSNRFIRARAVWVMAQLGPAGHARVRQLLEDDDADIRLVAWRALRAAGQPMLPLAASLADDPSPAVRREVALAMREVAYADSRDILVRLAAKFDGRDRWYLEALGTGSEGKENDLYSSLLGRLGDLPLEWSDAFAAIVWRLHPRLAVAPLSLRAMSSELSQEKRRQAMDTLAFIPSKEAALAMFDLAEKGPPDLRDAAAWWVNFRSHNDWRPFGISLSPGGKLAVATGIVLPDQPAYVSPVVRTGVVVDVNVDISGARHLYLVVTDGGDDIGCDWADWIHPRLIAADGEPVALTSLDWQKATSGWGQVLVNENTYGLPLKVNGRHVPVGIGTHAESVIVYQLPVHTQWSRFVAQAGLDNGRADLGGTDHPPGRPSVVFQVYHDGPAPEDQALRWQRILLDDHAPAEDRLHAARSLALSRTGGNLLLALAGQQRIPSDLRPEIAQRIHDNPDLTVRARADQFFRRDATEDRVLPPLSELAKRSGQAARGRELFFGRAACSTCHRVGDEGGTIGPDLSHAGSKFDRLALLDAIVNPSAAITFGFEATTLTLHDEEIITGFVVGAGDPLLIQDVSTGRQRAVPRRQITGQELMKTSVMPPAGSLALSPQDLADLASFLLHFHE